MFKNINMVFLSQRTYNKYNDAMEASSEIEDHYETPIDLIASGIAAFKLSKRKKVKRLKNWWISVNKSFSNQHFKEIFRASREFFGNILNLYKEALVVLENDDITRLELALALYFISRPITYRDMTIS